MPELAHVRHGRAVVRPYLSGPGDLPEWLIRVLGATELERHEFEPGRYHVQLALGDGVLAVEAGLPDHIEPWTGAVYVYVEDVDATYQRAIEAGATPVSPPADQPYGERNAGFRGPGGNTWYVGRLLG